MDAIALESIKELTTTLRAARLSGVSGRQARNGDVGSVDGLRGLARAYLGYAEEHPAVYEAMFVRRTDLVFGSAETPEVLRTAFSEILAGVAPFATGDAETLTEVFWSALHGQATLNHGGRLRPAHRRARADLLVAVLTSDRLLGNKPSPDAGFVPESG